jgi:PAS domain S-box-containing protein
MKRIDTGILWRTAAGLLLGCAGLALVTWIGVALDFSHPATGALLYMIVIVLASMTGNIAAGIGLAIIAALCLNYFFIEPRFTLQIDAPQDAVALGAFLTTSFVIAGLLKRARRLGETAVLKDRLQVIIDTIPAVVWSSSRDGSADFLNQRFRDYTGLSLEWGRSWVWMDALHPDERAMDDWVAMLAAGEPFEKEVRLQRADGEYRRFLLRFAPLRDEQGTIVEWYAASTDIEDLRRAEEELRQREAHLRDAQVELAHANRVTATGQLAASIAHEVSQPIAAALTNANAAARWLGAEPPDLDEVRQALGRIIRDGSRASDVIGRIRALVRKAAPRHDQLNINEEMLEVIELTSSELRSNGTSLQTQLADGLPLVQGDRIQLQQVMLNFILNAVEAMSGLSEPTRQLLIRTERDGPDGVLVAVEDSGPGIKPESLDRLFDPFYTTKPGGMGMGLSICRSIIEARIPEAIVEAQDYSGSIKHDVSVSIIVAPTGEAARSTLHHHSEQLQHWWLLFGSGASLARARGMSRDLRFGGILVSPPCAGAGARACRSPPRGVRSGDIARS